MKTALLGIGTWRFFLSFLVAISHLYGNMIHGPAAYAVWGFFVLSGFLMTLILTKKYGFSRGGLWDYTQNRFLRIYPGYLFAVLLGIATLFLMRKLSLESTVLNGSFRFPVSTHGILENIFMVPFLAEGALYVPVASALFVEVWAYALMPLMARSRHASILAFLITLAANIQYGISPETFPIRYSGFATGLLAFATGALVLHYYETLKRFAMPLTSVCVWCIHGILWLFDVYYPWHYGLYVSMFLSGWVVVSLFAIKSSNTDKWLGDLSYPVYLLHTTVGMFFYFLFGERSFLFFVLSFAVTVVFSHLVVVYLERPIQRFKRRKTKIDSLRYFEIPYTTNGEITADLSICCIKAEYGRYALDAAICAAMRIASSVARVLAMPFPAMSKAVPCSGVVIA